MSCFNACKMLFRALESLFDHKRVFELTLLISHKTNVFQFQMVFFSIDVDSLYTNIDTLLGLEAVKKALGASPTHLTLIISFYSFYNLPLPEMTSCLTNLFFFRYAVALWAENIHQPMQISIWLTGKNQRLSSARHARSYTIVISMTFLVYGTSRKLSLITLFTSLIHTTPLSSRSPSLDTIVFFSEIIDGYKTLGTVHPRT